MGKGILLGLVLGILIVIGSIYFYFSTGQAPVAVTSPEMPFEHKLARMAQHAYMDRLPHPNPGVPQDDPNFIEGPRQDVHWSNRPRVRLFGVPVCGGRLAPGRPDQAAVRRASHPALRARCGRQPHRGVRSALVDMGPIGWPGACLGRGDGWGLASF